MTLCAFLDVQNSGPHGVPMIFAGFNEPDLVFPVTIAALFQ